MNENRHESQSEFEAALIRLRESWELASVLNFLKVFEPIIGLKVSAEELEMALIQPNKCLAHVHVSLLKGIPPVSKNLKDPDVWVVALSKKLIMWWPWVAEGECPLAAAKGEEMANYKKLDPSIRLVILKALCETRADQHDVVSYINDAKNKNEISTFRKNNIGEDGNGISYWLDGNETIGLRLYKEVNTFTKKGTLTTISCEWQTLATNRDEFLKIMEEYKSSKLKLEVAVSATVETEAIPLLDKIYKKKQRELHKKKNDERIMTNFCRSGVTRSCRNRKPATYTFDEYDKTINEAIRESKRIKTRGEERRPKKENVANENPKQEDSKSSESDSERSKVETKDVNEDSGEESDGNDEDDSGEESDGNDEDNEEHPNLNSSEDGIEKEESVANEESDESAESDTDSESSKLETEYVSESDDDNKENTNHSSKANDNQNYKTVETKKITENGDRYIQKMKGFGTKKRLKQRPNHNTTLESAIVPDSEDDISLENSGN